MREDVRKKRWGVRKSPCHQKGKRGGTRVRGMDLWKKKLENTFKREGKGPPLYMG